MMARWHSGQNKKSWVLIPLWFCQELWVYSRYSGFLTHPKNYVLVGLKMWNCPVETHSSTEHYGAWRKTCNLLGGLVVVYRATKHCVRLEPEPWVVLSSIILWLKLCLISFVFEQQQVLARWLAKCTVVPMFRLSQTSSYLERKHPSNHFLHGSPSLSCLFFFLYLLQFFRACSPHCPGATLISTCSFVAEDDSQFS